MSQTFFLTKSKVMGIVLPKECLSAGLILFLSDTLKLNEAEFECAQASVRFDCSNDSLK